MTAEKEFVNNLLCSSLDVFFFTIIGSDNLLIRFARTGLVKLND